MKRKPSRIVETRHAGWVGDAEYGVTDMRGGDGAYCRKPCAQCPWRADLPTGVFPAEAYRISAPTAYDMSDRVFACHMAGHDKPQTCAGFLKRNADNNLSARLSQMSGKLNMREISDGGYPLYDNYRAMAEANGVAADDPVLARCRGNDE